MIKKFIILISAIMIMLLSTSTYAWTRPQPSCTCNLNGTNTFDYSAYFDQILNITSNQQANKYSAADWSNVSITTSQITDYSSVDTTVFIQNNSIQNCSGTDKLTKISGVIQCAADVSGGAVTEQLNESWSTSLEFITSSASSFNSFLGTAISSGTIAAASGDLIHPGVIGLRDSTTASGGYMIRTDITSFLLSGNEKATFIFRQNTVRVGIKYRMGFFDTSTVAEPVDGCYFNINSSNTGVFDLTGICRSNNIQSNTTTYIPITNLQWYTGIIEVNPTASQVKFSLYNLINELVWNDSITTNIPNTVGRETGFGIIANQNSTDAAADIVQLDYMKLQLFNRTAAVRTAFTSSAPIRFSQEFLTASASVSDPFLGTAISSGTAIQSVLSNGSHPGILNLSDSTTAQGGYRIMTDATSFLIAGNESASFVFRHANWGRATASYRLGFQDSTAINTLPTDGCWLNISYNGITMNNRTVHGVCSANSLRTNSTTRYSLNYNAWYTGKIIVNSVASSVNFSLIDSNNNLVWNESITTNIPTSVGRETGFGVITGESSTNAAQPIIQLDYMDLMINGAVIR